MPTKCPRQIIIVYCMVCRLFIQIHLKGKQILSSHSLYEAHVCPVNLISQPVMDLNLEKS